MSEPEPPAPAPTADEAASPPASAPTITTSLPSPSAAPPSAPSPSATPAPPLDPSPAPAAPEASTSLLPPSDASSLNPLKRKSSNSSLASGAEDDSEQPQRDPWGDEQSPAYKAAKSASQWNSLLLWARKGRGPQWEWGTGMYHVDRNSPEYYAGVTPTGDAPPLSAVPGHLANGGNGSIPGSPGSGYATPKVDAGVYDSGRPRRSRR
ncbi:hypothetical protein MNV49_006065 [Pseudohyphozyma bogoriensis]|nr:hypothetical protein MNV49_006065 [Pseudohyphozyma bogoriensis]